MKQLKRILVDLRLEEDQRSVSQREIDKEVEKLLGWRISREQFAKMDENPQVFEKFRQKYGLETSEPNSNLKKILEALWNRVCEMYLKRRKLEQDQDKALLRLAPNSNLINSTNEELFNNLFEKNLREVVDIARQMGVEVQSKDIWDIIQEADTSIYDKGMF